MVKKKRSANSARWLQEHANDHYVQKAKQQGLRSRAWFKLSELQQRDHLLKAGMTVIDLGAAPGGWSHYATTQIGPKGRVIACDLLPMEPITGVDFLQGDFCDPALLDRLLMTLGQGKAQVVLSDMAPNMSGTLAVDQARSMHLVELAFDLCQQVLACGGSLIIKVFQGDGFDIYWRQISTRFQRAKVRKPPASRARSREVYIVASGYKV